MQERMFEAIRGNLEELTERTVKAAHRLENDLRREGLIGPVKRVKGFDVNAQKAERKRLKNAKKQARKKLLTFHT